MLSHGAQGVISMFSRPLAFLLLALGCVTAAAGGAYVADPSQRGRHGRGVVAAPQPAPAAAHRADRCRAGASAGRRNRGPGHRERDPAEQCRSPRRSRPSVPIRPRANPRRRRLPRGTRIVLRPALPSRSPRTTRTESAAPPRPAPVNGTTAAHADAAAPRPRSAVPPPPAPEPARPVRAAARSRRDAAVRGSDPAGRRR